MNTLAETLERFNRKERNLLIRAALREPNEPPLQLATDFRLQIADQLGLTDIPAEAWWATDYHFDWLAGALAVYVDGNANLNATRSNRTKDGRRLVEGNQEDVDLLIAFRNELVLIEAKAYGAFSNAQMKSKLDRLALLYTFYQNMLPPAEHAINFHFLLISPRPPQRLTSEWPAWAYKGTGIPWIELTLDPSISVLKVTRCDDSGHSSDSGPKWCVIENRPEKPHPVPQHPNTDTER